MRINFMMAPLVLCLIATVATPASAAHRHHRLRHHSTVQHTPQFQRPMMSEQPDGPVMQPAMMQAATTGPARPVSGAGTRPVSRAGNRRAQAYQAQASFSGPATFGGGGSLVAEARRWIGGNPTGRSSLWCGNFMNFVLNRTGHQASPSNQARSFASYGHRLPGPQVGAIAVMSRGHGGGHVGVVTGIDPNGNPIIISGNHGHKVGEGVYPRGRIYAYVMP
jgi:uncharacterized protein (TIGR02594 family)